MKSLSDGPASAVNILPVCRVSYSTTPVFHQSYRSQNIRLHRVVAYFLLYGGLFGVVIIYLSGFQFLFLAFLCLSAVTSPVFLSVAVWV